MSARDTGGAAFPSEIRDVRFGRVGMSLRDYFAGQALTRVQDDDDNDKVHAFAKWAYKLADAMLAEQRAS